MPRKYAGINLPPANGYVHKSLEECEMKGNHRAEPDSWPPATRTSNPDGGLGVRCTLCGCHGIVYVGNEPQQSGWDIVEPKRAKQPA